MSIYNFSPSPTTAENGIDYAVWQDGFSHEELDQIIKYSDENLEAQKAIIGGLSKDASYEDIRKSKTGWISLNQDTMWLYDRLAYIARMTNAKYWNFDLSGFVEDFQYTLYDEKDDHYTWHVDAMKSGTGASPRKLSMVIQLSDPYDYEGGELELKTGPTDIQIRKERGLVTLFPSYVLHRVTPLEDGIRRSLVVWVAGPPFK